MRSTYEDIIEIYEVNRKEAARILLDIDRWFTRGTFRPRQGADPSAPGVQLELSVIEVRMLVLSGIQVSQAVDDPVLRVRSAPIEAKIYVLSCTNHRDMQIIGSYCWSMRW